jgi:hypothetical protein
MDDDTTPAGRRPRLYSLLGDLRRGRTESERWQLVRYATGHLETADMRRRVLAFLDRYLCDDAAVNAERLRPQGMRESRPGSGGPISSAMNNAGSNR